MTDTTKTGGLDLTPREMLDAYDACMSGSAATDEQYAIAATLVTAACFSAQAFAMRDDFDMGASAMVRAFLLALIDPLHPDLDYLRSNPASGAVARAARGEA